TQNASVRPVRARAAPAPPFSAPPPPPPNRCPNKKCGPARRAASPPAAAPAQWPVDASDRQTSRVADGAAELPWPPPASDGDARARRTTRKTWRQSSGCHPQASARRLRPPPPDGPRRVRAWRYRDAKGGDDQAPDPASQRLPDSRHINL